MTLVKIETGSRIPPPEGPFRILFSGHRPISAPDQDIVDNGIPKCVEWFKYDSFENPIWRTAAMSTHTTYRRSILRRQLDRISSRYKHRHSVTTIDDIFFLVLISTETHSTDLNYSHFLPNFPSRHNKTAFVYRMATYGTVPFSLIIVCRIPAIFAIHTIYHGK